MNPINQYRTPNKEIFNERSIKYLSQRGGRYKNFNINNITQFKDIPDGIEVLVDYADIVAIRTMYIATEIILESIYRELPELFEE